MQPCPHKLCWPTVVGTAPAHGVRRENQTPLLRLQTPSQAATPRTTAYAHMQLFQTDLFWDERLAAQLPERAQPDSCPGSQGSGAPRGRPCTGAARLLPALLGGQGQGGLVSPLLAAQRPRGSPRRGGPSRHLWVWVGRVAEPGTCWGDAAPAFLGPPTHTAAGALTPHTGASSAPGHAGARWAGTARAHGSSTPHPPPPLRPCSHLAPTSPLFSWLPAPPRPSGSQIAHQAQLGRGEAGAETTRLWLPQRRRPAPDSPR